MKVSDILHATADNPEATIIGDLAIGENIPVGVFDCIICTQTLPFIYDYKSALENLHHALKPGGTLLLTFAGISQISRYDMDRWGDFWRFTSLSARRFCDELFSPEKVRVETYGNVLAAVGLLHGLAKEELRTKELDFKDPDYEVIIGVAATKEEINRDANHQ